GDWSRPMPPSGATTRRACLDPRHEVPRNLRNGRPIHDPPRGTRIMCRRTMRNLALLTMLLAAPPRGKADFQLYSGAGMGTGPDAIYQISATGQKTVFVPPTNSEYQGLAFDSLGQLYVVQNGVIFVYSTSGHLVNDLGFPAYQGL